MYSITVWYHAIKAGMALRETTYGLDCFIVGFGKQTKSIEGAS